MRLQKSLGPHTLTVTNASTQLNETYPTKHRYQRLLETILMLPQNAQKFSNSEHACGYTDDAEPCT